MNTKRLLLSVCVCLLVEGPALAQEITEPGWFNSERWLAPDTNAAMEAFSFQSESLVSYPEIAETVTADIEALARGLGNDPKRIFDYVHDHIRHVLYFGSKKGAQLTLLERSGNDFDQCALLVALLRAAGHSPTYQFGVLQMPYESPDHFDLQHWLGLSMLNTNWSLTQSLFGYALGARGYPYSAYPSGTNTVAFHRVWVVLPLGGTNYYLDPAFKISEPVTGIDLHSAMGLDTNTLSSVAGGTTNANWVQSLSESSLRNKLRDYTTNLLAYIQNNNPNASVEEILGGQRIVSSAGSPLSQSLPFSVYTAGGQLSVLEWDNQPTNLMAKLSISFAGTNYQWYIPALQGQKLSLTFSNSGLAQVWQEDTLLLQTTNTGSASRISATLSVNHPHGSWNVGQNAFVDSTFNDQSFTTSYQRTNATYNLTYGFEVSSQWLQQRQERLDKYRQQGLADTSREVVSETLNVMGLSWLLQTGLANQTLAQEFDMLYQQHHGFGRMAQEKGNGYYIDIVRLTGVTPSTGFNTEDALRVYNAVDVMAYFNSAMEHGVVEQLQSGSAMASSTVKMLQLGNTNGLKTFIANSTNWSTVTPQLVNYDANDLNFVYFYLTNGFTLILPGDARTHTAGSGSWGGYGLAGVGFLQGSRATIMVIAGGYFGGYSSDPFAIADPNLAGFGGQYAFDPNGPFNGNPFGADPVDMASGAFALNQTDLMVGRSEPRGFTFNRSYSSNRRFQNPAGMSYGWTHNYFFKLSELSAPDLGLGRTTPAQMAPMLVATRAARELYSPQPNPKNWLMTTLIAKWGIDQLLGNSVAITLGKDTLQFVRQPNDTFTPPAKSSMTLLKTNSVYWLQERHGNTFKFNTAGRLTNIVDQYNQSLRLTYGTGASSNWVTTVTDWKNRTLTLIYSGTPLRLASIADSLGRSVAFGYTTNAGQLDLTSVTDPENKTSTFLYDTNHQVLATKDALGRTVVSNVYDNFSRVVTQYSEASANKAWQFLWTDFDNTEQDPTGGQRRFLFDDKRRQIGVQDALGNLTQTFFDGQDHVVMTVSPLNETNRFEFDGRHNLLRSIDPLNYTNQFVYDTQDHLQRTIDARGNTNFFGYNAQHSLTGTTNGAGDWLSFGFNSEGNITNRTDAGGTTTYGHDSFGELNTVTYPGGLGSETLQNSASGDVTNHTNPRGFVTAFQYNLRRELTNTIAPTNVVARLAYDPVGNVSSATDARGFSRSNAWSATRKLLATTLPGTPQGVPMTTNVYDNRDWLTRTINQLQQVAIFTNDAAQRLTSTTDPLNRTTRFAHDAVGRQTAVTNAANEVSQQFWSVRSEMTKSVDGANHNVLFAFDAARNQVALTNRNGKRWQFQFDGANRLTNTITPLGRETRVTREARGLVSTVREPSTQTTTNFYDAKARLTNILDAVASRLLRYDANDNVTNIVENGKTNTWTFDAYDQVQSYRDADGNLIQYRSDANGNITNLIYPGNRIVAYAFDSLNRPTNITDWLNRKTIIEYDLANRVKKVTRPNGTVRELNHDVAGQTTNIWERFTNGTPIAMFKLNWNPAARIGWEFAAPPPHAYTPPARTMTFDDDNRLDTFNGVNVTNDLDGNMIFGPLTNNTLVPYTFDARNQLLNVGGLGYGYDPAGNRTAITNGASVARFVVNPNAPLSQVLMRVRTGLTNYYIYGLGLQYEITETATSTNILTYHFDFRGSTVALTDENGNVTDRIEYSPYATTTYRSGTNDTPFLYNGRYGVQTDANGLLYMRARYYNPLLCRFLSPDLIGFSGGLNFYVYANGNPVNILDPDGLQGTVRVNESGPSSYPFQNPLPSGIQGRQLTPFDSFVNGVWVGGTVALVTVVAAPVAASSLVAVGMSGTAASATVTVGVSATAVYGLSGVAGDAFGSIEGRNWNQVSFDAGLFTGGLLIGASGGGRALGQGVSGQPSTLPSSLNPFADIGLGYNPNYPGGSLLSWLGKAPTPSSGGAAIGFTADAAYSLGYNSSVPIGLK